MDGNRKGTIASFFHLAMLSVVIVFACFSFFGKSVAWFVNNTNVTADGMSIGLCSDNSVSIASIGVYKVHEDNNSATLYDNPPADDLGNILTLNKYDSVFVEKREHTPIIIKITLENFRSGTDAAELTITFSLKDETGYTMTDGGKEVLMPFISNFINVACSSDPELSDAGKSPAEYYPDARDLFLSPAMSSATQTFVNYTESGDATSIISKADYLTFDISKPAGQETLDVYLFLSYDENLIARFVKDNEYGIGSVSELGGSFEWGSDVMFDKDIAKISFAESSSETK